MSYQYPFIPGHASMSATPPATYRWDDGEQQHQLQQDQQHQHLERQVLQHPLQHQPEQSQDVYTGVPTPSSASTVLPQDQVPIVPSQDPRRPGSSHVSEGDELQLRLQHVSVPALLQPEHMRPPMIDTSRAASYRVGTSASPSSGPPSADPSSAFHAAVGLGPVRAHNPVHPDPRVMAHPYRRPQSAAGVVIARSRREPEEVRSVRHSRQPSTSRSMRVPYSTSATVASTPREVGFPTAISGAVKMMSTYKGLINPAYSGASTTNVLIRTDMHFDSETTILTALCELPGRTKDDVTVVLSTNILNRVKQVAITAKSPPLQDIADEGYVVRERKLGGVSRTFVVPSETTPGDITVEMRDGLLTLKIQCPPPSQQDDAQEILIR